MRSAGLEHVDIAEDDASLWARQRAGQRSREAALMRVAARPRELAGVLEAAQGCAGTLVGRAGLGISFIEVEPEAVGRLREALPPKAVSILLDAPAEFRRSVDVWGTGEGPAIELMRRIKGRFDPARACNPGVFVGGI
jgi:glycolate oxidase FAD binding subunit